MKHDLGTIIALLAGVIAGTVVFGVLAESQFSSEAASIGARLGLPASSGASNDQVLKLIETVNPGISGRLKTAALTTAVGGAAAAVLTYALLQRGLA